MTKPSFLTVADAARRLGVTPAAVVAMERRGDLAALRTEGGVRLFEPDEVERLVAQRAEAGQRSGANAPPTEVAS